MTDRPKQIYVILAIVVIALVAGAVMSLLVLRQLNSPVNASSQEVEFVVGSNETVNSIAERLEQEDLIRSPAYFRIRVQLEGKDQDIVAGKYDLNTAMTTSQIINTITSEESVSYEETTVTFPEGWRVEQYADALTEAGLVESPEEFIEATEDPRWNEEYPILHSRPSGSGLEGYLFPDTYVFRDDATPEDIVDTLLTTFEERITPELRASVEALGISIHQGLTLASIVEREATLPEERPTIASVYFNRYSADMPLQADPTVQYQLGEEGDWWPVISGADLERSGAYNTYLNPGFPPAPICNPGLDAIRAAFAPEPSPYLFFVATGDGSHAFAETFEEHQENIDLYLNDESD